MGERIPFPKSVNLCEVQDILEHMERQDTEGFLIDFRARRVDAGSDKDTQHFKGLLEKAGIPYGWQAVQEEEDKCV